VIEMIQTMVKRLNPIFFHPSKEQPKREKNTKNLAQQKTKSS
jgi:hypothetical protein